MTEKELDEYRALVQEIEYLEKKLKQIKDGVSMYRSPILTGMPSGKGRTSNPTAQTVMQRENSYREEILTAMLEKSLKEQKDKLLRIERYVKSIPYAEIRIAMRLKYIDGMSWSQIGQALACDRSGISKKVRDYVRFPTIPT